MFRQPFIAKASQRPCCTLQAFVFAMYVFGSASFSAIGQTSVAPMDTILANSAMEDSLNLSVDSSQILKPDQNDRAILVDSPKKEQKEERHSPTKAAWHAAVLPGWGQIYNKKYWKLPIVYGGLGGLGYWVYFNADQHRYYRQAFLAKTDEDPATVDPLPFVSESSILQTKEYYRRQLDASILFTLGFYCLQIVDAVVDAHLFNFDVSDDLTLQWRPVIPVSSFRAGMPTPQAAGIHFSLTYR